MGSAVAHPDGTKGACLVDVEGALRVAVGMADLPVAAPDSSEAAWADRGSAVGTEGAVREAAGVPVAVAVAVARSACKLVPEICPPAFL